MTSSSVNLAKELIPNGFSYSSREIEEVEKERWLEIRRVEVEEVEEIVESERETATDNLGCCFVAALAAVRPRRRVELLSDMIDSRMSGKEKKKKE